MSTDSNTPFAVITGASSGIGYELAKQFAQHGFDLLVVAEGEDIAQAAATLRAFGTAVEHMQADLATYDGVESVYGRIQSMNRPVDALAVNAGVGVWGPFLETSLQEEFNLINLNVNSTIHLTKRVLTDMVSRNAGKILFTSSIAAEMPGPFTAVYNASKAFVQSFAQALRNELKDTDITITALQPGPTDTDFFARAGMEATKIGQDEKDDPADVARDGFEALMAGKDYVVAGSFKNKSQTIMAQITPERMTAEMERKLQEPGSAQT